MKQHGKSNDLIQRVKDDPYFDPIKGQLDSLLEPSTFVGRAPAQVKDFLRKEVAPVLTKYQDKMDEGAELKI